MVTNRFWFHFGVLTEQIKKPPPLKRHHSMVFVLL
ncbi:hypothetical protein OIU79_025018, partial [Salix purpurea]